MAQKTEKRPADYIVPLHMNGLTGRMLRMPPKRKKQREIMLIYGHHASLERMFGVAEYLNSYGGVTMPDLPGFGGMQAFYSIGEKPTLDNLADYLAAFVKLRYNNRRLSIIGMSFGFAIVTRMLQKHPEIAAKVDIVFSLVGLVHRDDFKFKKRNYFMLRTGARLFSNRLIAGMITKLLIRAPIIRAMYRLVEDRHSKLHDASPLERKRRINFEIGLWKSNDIRTYMTTSTIMFTLNLLGKNVALSVCHISVDNDRYFNNVRVEEHMRAIYSDFILAETSMPAHAPTVIASAKEASSYIPAKMRQLLRQKTT